MALPESHRQNNEKLVADGYVELFEIVLRNGDTIRLKENNTVQWQDKTWTGVPLSFEGYSSAAGDKLSRPVMTVVNPEGYFSTIVRDGHLLKATVTRYSVLYDDIVNNRNVFHKKVWIAWNIPQLTRDMIQVELRNPMDGVNFDVPARMYIPPEFPSVTL